MVPRPLILISDASADDTRAFAETLEPCLVVASPFASAKVACQSLAAIPSDPGDRVEQAVNDVFDAAVHNGAEVYALVLVLAPPAMLPTLVECSLADWQHHFEARMRRVFLIARRALQEILAAGRGGSIVLIGPDASLAVDAIEHAGLEAMRAMAKSLAKEYGRRQIRTNLIETSAPACAVELAAWLVSSGASFDNGDILQAGATPP
jgi:NAD(P)-dependent dehydrogenase (short-subunit alcohol dehydrogenase family)